MNATETLRQRLITACDDAEARAVAQGEPDAGNGVPAGCRGRVYEMSVSMPATEFAVGVLGAWCTVLGGRRKHGDVTGAATVGSLLREGLSIVADVLGEAAVWEQPMLVRVIDLLREGPSSLSDLVSERGFPRALAESLEIVRTRPAQLGFFQDFLRAHYGLAHDGAYDRTRRISGHAADDLEAALPRFHWLRRRWLVRRVLGAKIVAYRERVSPEDRLKSATLREILAWVDQHGR